MEKRIRITVSLVAHLAVEEVWPDGDAPEVIDAEAVEDLIEDCGGIIDVLGDWNLGNPHVAVTVAPERDPAGGTPPATDAEVADALANMRAEQWSEDDPAGGTEG